MKGIFDTSLGPVHVGSNKRYMVVVRYLPGDSFADPQPYVFRRTDQIGQATTSARGVLENPNGLWLAIVLDTCDERELTPMPDRLIKSDDWVAARRRRKTDSRGPRKVETDHA